METALIKTAICLAALTFGFVGQACVISADKALSLGELVMCPTQDSFWPLMAL